MNMFLLLARILEYCGLHVSAKKHLDDLEEKILAESIDVSLARTSVDFSATATPSRPAQPDLHSSPLHFSLSRHWPRKTAPTNFSWTTPRYFYLNAFGQKCSSDDALPV